REFQGKALMKTKWKGPRFDAELLAEGTMDAVTNARLQLTLKINFQQVTTSHALARPRAGGVGGFEFPDCGDTTTGKWFAIRNCQARDDWRGYKSKVRRMAERAWNNQLWLVTPDSYKKLDWPTEWYRSSTHRCNVDCELFVEEAGPADAHITIEVVCLDVAEGSEFLYKCTDFRSHRTLYDQFDI